MSGEARPSGAAAWACPYAASPSAEMPFSSSRVLPFALSPRARCSGLLSSKISSSEAMCRPSALSVAFSAPGSSGVLE